MGLFSFTDLSTHVNRKYGDQAGRKLCTITSRFDCSIPSLVVQAVLIVKLIWAEVAAAVWWNVCQWELSSLNTTTTLSSMLHCYEPNFICWTPTFFGNNLGKIVLGKWIGCDIIFHLQFLLIWEVGISHCFFTRLNLKKMGPL